MAKLTLTDITAGYVSTTTINANNSAIETALENTLSRDGTAPNTMGANLDMNSNKIVNVTDPTGNQDASTKKYVDDRVAAITGLNPETDQDITGNWDFQAPIVLTERGAAIADEAGKGQLWLRDFSPNQLAFTDDAGNDWFFAYRNRSQTFSEQTYFGGGIQLQASQDFFLTNGIDGGLNLNDQGFTGSGSNTDISFDSLDISLSGQAIRFGGSNSSPAITGDQAFPTDDQTVTLDCPSVGFAWVCTGDATNGDNEYAYLFINGTNLLSINAGSDVSVGTGGSNPDVDTNLNIWISSSGTMSVKNRLGSTTDVYAIFFGL